MTVQEAMLAGNVPSHVDPAVVVDYDMFGDSRFRATGDLHQGLFQLAAEAGRGIRWTPRNGGHWFINDQELLFQAAKSPDLFSNNANPDRAGDDGQVIMIPPYDGAGPNFGPLCLDPPRHGVYRMPLMKVFAPNEIKRMEASVRALAKTLIAALARKGRGEYLDAVGEPLPVTVFMKMMGMPLARLAEFRGWMNDMASDDNDRRIIAIGKVAEAMRALVAARQQERQDDLISHLLDCEIDARPPTMADMEGYCLLLFTAGLDTLVNAFTYGMCHLAIDPALQERVRADRALIPELIEEILRRYAVVMVPRMVAKDAEFGGVTVRTGDPVILMLPAGNTDPRAFADPMRFDIDREDKAHMTFSSGPHRCVGSHLARLEMRVFYEEWFAAMPNVRLDPDEAPTYRPGFNLTICKLPLVWNPAD